MGSNLALSELFFLNKDLERERRELVERELQFRGFLQFGDFCSLGDWIRPAR